MILCADCLFFDEARSDLVETIYGWLANDGLALVMAPRRGSTFEQFAEAAIKRGFVARQIDRYEATIWSRHLELLENSQEYCPDLHYPILLELTKQKKTSPGWKKKLRTRRKNFDRVRGEILTRVPLLPAHPPPSRPIPFFHSVTINRLGLLLRTCPLPSPLPLFSPDVTISLLPSTLYNIFHLNRHKIEIILIVTSNIRSIFIKY